MTQDQNLSFLVDCELVQVAIGENEVIRNFTGDVSILVATAIQIDRGDLIDDSRAAGAALLELLGGAIEDATGTTDGTLTIRLRNGRRPTIFDSWSEYESDTISHSGSRSAPRSHSVKTAPRVSGAAKRDAHRT